MNDLLEHAVSKPEGKRLAAYLKKWGYKVERIENEHIDLQKLEKAHDTVSKTLPRPSYVSLSAGEKVEMIKRKNALVRGAGVGRFKRMVEKEFERQEGDYE